MHLRSLRNEWFSGTDIRDIGSHECKSQRIAQRIDRYCPEFVCERLGEQTMSFHCVCKTFTEQDGKWIGHLFPDNRRHFPVLLDVAQSEKAQFFGGLIIGEVAAVFDDFAQLYVQTFNGVGCINHFSNFRRFPPPSQRKESPVPIAVATSV